VADREAQRVKAPEHERQRTHGILVHDQPAGVRPRVEAFVRDGEDPQSCERDRAARAPEVGGDDLVADRRAERARGGVEAGGGSERRRCEVGEKLRGDPFPDTVVADRSRFCVRAIPGEPPDAR
jgi:hypothetical protein